MTAHPLDRPDLDSQAMAACRAAGCEHLTLLAFFNDGQQALRLYSDMRAVFPLDGIKDIPEGPLRDLIYVQGKPQFFDGPEQIREVFWDHEDILGAGVQAILNVPLLQDGNVVGSLNCIYRGSRPPTPIAETAQAIADCFSHTNGPA